MALGKQMADLRLPMNHHWKSPRRVDPALGRHPFQLLLFLVQVLLGVVAHYFGLSPLESDRVRGLWQHYSCHFLKRVPVRQCF